MTHSHMVLALPWMVIQDGTSLEDHFEGTDWHTQLERLHCSGLLRTTGRGVSTSTAPAELPIGSTFGHPLSALIAEVRYQMAVLLGCSPPFRKGMFVSTVRF